MRWIAHIALILAFAPHNLFAEEPAIEEAHLHDYRSYKDAVAAGDYAIATTHALLAWQSAEDNLGSHAITGALAYLYGRHVILTDVESAQKALRRASKLQKSGKVELPAADLALYVAYAELISGRYQRSEAAAFERALDEMRGQTPNSSSELSHMWHIKATEEMPINNVLSGFHSVAKRAESYLDARPANKLDLTLALLFRGATSVVSIRRSINRLHGAHHDFLLACSFSRTADTVDNYDPVMANAIAWGSLVNKMSLFIGFEDYPETGPYSDIEHAKCNWKPKTYTLDQESGCVRGKVDQAARFRFPRMRKAGDFATSIYFAYQLTDDLQVKRPVILAEVPKSRHGDALRKDLPSLRFTKESDEAVCQRDIAKTWSYVSW